MGARPEKDRSGFACPRPELSRAEQWKGEGVGKRNEGRRGEGEGEGGRAERSEAMLHVEREEEAIAIGARRSSSGDSRR